MTYDFIRCHFRNKGHLKHMMLGSNISPEIAGRIRLSSIWAVDAFLFRLREATELPSTSPGAPDVMPLDLSQAVA